MIRYTLICDKSHEFESWFQSATAFDTLAKAGHVSCAVCGSIDIRKSVMAPRIGKSVSKGADVPSETIPDRPLSAPASVAEQAMRELRAKIEANSENVGTNFATEARAIHEGTAPERAIYGEAKLEEARSLMEDGIPVVPLPFSTGRKTN